MEGNEYSKWASLTLKYEEDSQGLKRDERTAETTV